MGFFGNNEKKIIEELFKKSEDHCKYISREIDDLLDDLQTDYNKNKFVVAEFINLVEELKSKLNPDEVSKLADFSKRLSKVKSCAKKGVESLRELARDQKKVTRETKMEYEEYFQMK